MTREGIRIMSKDEALDTIRQAAITWLENAQQTFARTIDKNDTDEELRVLTDGDELDFEAAKQVRDLELALSLTEG